jgi:hypothetical protein
VIPAGRSVDRDAQAAQRLDQRVALVLLELVRARVVVREARLARGRRQQAARREPPRS